MRKKVFAPMLVIAVLFLSGCMPVQDLAAMQGGAPPTECTLETIKGVYIFESQGNFIIDEETALPYVEAGTWTLDGNGNAEGVFSASLGNEIIEKEAFSATYTHNSDCVFTALAPVGENEFVQFDLYTSPSGQTMTYFGPGFSGTQRKQANSPPTECTLETIKGVYIFESQGNFIIDEETALPYVEAGTWTLDGNGNAEGVFSASLGNEIIEKEAFSATYTHNSDCVFTALAPVGENEFVQFDLYTSPSGQTMTYFGPGFSGIQRKQ